MSTSKVLLGVAIGIAAGAAVGVLLAPDSGANTRRMIQDKSQGVVGNIKGKWNQVVDGLSHQIQDVKEDAHDFAEKAKNKLSEPVRRMASGNTPT
jgi:gas vesicle protein